MQLIDGKKTAADIKAEIKAEVEQIVANGGKRPHLAAILVGHDGGSETYVAAKVKACEECGFKSTLQRFESDIDEETLLAKIDEFNRDSDIDGFIVQLPLPKHIDEQRVIRAVDPNKDVDGFHPVNVGRLVMGEPGLVPCTPAGCLKMLELAGIPIDGARAVVVGRSNIVGKPMASLLLQENATVTVCHSHTKDLAAVTREADILVAAVGRPGFIRADMVKPGATVIDVGINRLPPDADHPRGKLVGDVDFAGAAEVAGAITPVPGGVGLLTVAMLMENVVTAAACQLAAQKD